MNQSFTIPGRLPGYNELKAHYMRSARVKGEAMNTVGWAAKAAHVGAVDGPATITILCYEPNAKRDPDNVTSGAAKCILYALQNIGVLKNDNRKHVTPILPKPEVDRDDTRVEVTISQGVYP